MGMCFILVPAKMKQKIMLWTFVFVLLLSSISAFEVTTFTNDLTEENLTFTNDQNFTRYLDLPMYINFTYSNINISGVHANDNLSVEIGIDATMVTSTSGYTNQGNMNDGNFATFGGIVGAGDAEALGACSE